MRKRGVEVSALRFSLTCGGIPGGRDDEGLAAVEDPGEVVDVVVVAPDLVEFTGDLDAAVVLVLDEHVGAVATDHHDVADGGWRVAAVEGTELADELPRLKNI